MEQTDANRQQLTNLLTALHGYRALVSGWCGPDSVGIDEYTAEVATTLLVTIYDRGAYLPVVVPVADGSLEFVYEHPMTRACVTIDKFGELLYVADSRSGESLNVVENATAARVASSLLADLGSPNEAGDTHDPLGDRARLERALATVDDLIDQRTRFIGKQYGTMFDAARKDLEMLGSLRKVLADAE
jgi:hypothetical protein